MSFRTATVGIFGGTGFVGQHLVPALHRHGHPSRIFTRGHRAPAEIGVVPGARVVHLPNFEHDTLVQKLQGCDVVINLIGILNEKGRDGSGFQRVHVGLTERILKAAAAADIQRYLHMSSLRAGEGSSHYLRSRGDAEAAVRQATTLRPTIFQPSVIFGIGDSFLNRFGGLLKLMPFMPLACPDARFSPVHVGDVTEAFCRAIADVSTEGQTFELCGPNAYTLRQLVEYVRDTLGLARPIIGLPDWAASAQAAVMDFVPGKPFSSDNFRSLQIDSVCRECGLPALGLLPTALEAAGPAALGLEPEEARLRVARSSRSFVSRGDLPE